MPHFAQHLRRETSYFFQSSSNTGSWGGGGRTGLENIAEKRSDLGEYQFASDVAMPHECHFAASPSFSRSFLIIHYVKTRIPPTLHEDSRGSS